MRSGATTWRRSPMWWISPLTTCGTRLSRAYGVRCSKQCAAWATRSSHSTAGRGSSMNRSRFVRWPLRRRKGHFSQEAGAALFQGLRMRLTLWYCAVLAAALVLFSVALYLSAQYFLLTPIERDAAMHAQVHMNEWVTGSPGACPPFRPPGPFGQPSGPGQRMPELVVCFDQHGSLLPGENTAGLPSAFLTPTTAPTSFDTK